MRAKGHRDWLKSWLQLPVRGNEPLRKCRNGSHAVDASDKDGEKQAEGGHGFGKPQRGMSVVGDTLDSNFGLRTVLGMVACQRLAYAFKTHDLMELKRELAQAFYEGAPFYPDQDPMFGVPPPETPNWYTIKQAQERYGIVRACLLAYAKTAGVLRLVSAKKILVDAKKADDFFLESYGPFSEGRLIRKLGRRDSWNRAKHPLESKATRIYGLESDRNDDGSHLSPGAERHAIGQGQIQDVGAGVRAGLRARDRAADGLHLDHGHSDAGPAELRDARRSRELRP